MQTQKTIKDLSVIELKAAKCDHFENIEQSQKIIMAINKELASRQETPVEKTEGEPAVESPYVAPEEK